MRRQPPAREPIAARLPALRSRRRLHVNSGSGRRQQAINHQLETSRPSTHPRSAARQGRLGLHSYTARCFPALRRAGASSAARSRARPMLPMPAARCRSRAAPRRSPGTLGAKHLGINEFEPFVRGRRGARAVLRIMSKPPARSALSPPLLSHAAASSVPPRLRPPAVRVAISMLPAVVRLVCLLPVLLLLRQAKGLAYHRPCMAAAWRAAPARGNPHLSRHTPASYFLHHECKPCSLAPTDILTRPARLVAGCRLLWPRLPPAWKWRTSDWLPLSCRSSGQSALPCFAVMAGQQPPVIKPPVRLLKSPHRVPARPRGNSVSVEIL